MFFNLFVSKDSFASGISCNSMGSFPPLIFLALKSINSKKWLIKKVIIVPAIKIKTKGFVKLTTKFIALII